MFSSIRAAIAAVLLTVKSWFVKQEQSVETILNGWFKVVQQLESHAEAKVEEVFFHRDVAVKASEKAAAAQAEAAAAKTAAASIAGVLKPAPVATEAVAS